MSDTLFNAKLLVIQKAADTYTDVNDALRFMEAAMGYLVPPLLACPPEPAQEEETTEPSKRYVPVDENPLKASPVARRILSAIVSCNREGHFKPSPIELMNLTDTSRATMYKYLERFEDDGNVYKEAVAGKTKDYAKYTALTDVFGKALPPLVTPEEVLRPEQATENKDMHNVVSVLMNTPKKGSLPNQPKGDDQ